MGTTKWWPAVTGGGGGGGMVIGDSVIGGLPNCFLYIDGAGNLTQDSLAQRKSDSKHNSFILSETYAQAAEDFGGGISFGVQADNLGSNPTITFDGVSDVDTIVAAWNLANPTDTVSVFLAEQMCRQQEHIH